MDNQTSKPVFVSKTVIGAVASLLVAVFSILGYEVQDSAQFTEQITAIVVLVATTVLTVYGRFNATTKLVIKKDKNDSSTPN